MSNMIVRIRSPAGVTRLTIDDDPSLDVFYQRVLEAVPDARLTTSFILSLDPAGTLPIPIDGQLKLGAANLKHGDFVYLTHSGAITASTSKKQEESASGFHPLASSTSAFDAKTIREDEVDVYLRKQTGTIQRKRDPRYCRHGDSGMCQHCQPLEPFDPEYLAANKIKHLSFHAHLRKLAAGSKTQGSSSTAASGSSNVHLLKEPDFRVNRNCPYHAPYPAGICTKCQPSAIILHQQPFRQVDHVEFSTPAIVEDLVAGWRKTGLQRFAWMIGKYEPYDGVPLGIKAVVKALYQPPQDNSVDGFTLLSNDVFEDNGTHPSKHVKRVSHIMGLGVVGMIYTDLRDDGTGTGRVLAKRGSATFFLSAAECHFIARQQMAHPSPCKDCIGGRYGSKFVTVVAAGDAEGKVALNAYQISQTGVAMVKANIIIPSIDPSIMLVTEESTPTKPNSTASQICKYVPEVFYKVKNEYGVQVQKKADPGFPVDYLLVTLSHGSPVEPTSMFRNPSSSGFPERSLIDHLQRLANQASTSPTQPTITIPANIISNFHALVWIFQTGLLNQHEFEQICRVVMSIDQQSSNGDLKFNGAIMKLVHDSSTFRNSAVSQPDTLPQAQKPHQIDKEDSGSDKDLVEITDSTWSCPHCTFINRESENRDSCQVCALPRHYEQ